MSFLPRLLQAALLLQVDLQSDSFISSLGSSTLFMGNSTNRSRDSYIYGIDVVTVLTIGVYVIFVL